MDRRKGPLSGWLKMAMRASVNSCHSFCSHKSWSRSVSAWRGSDTCEKTSCRKAWVASSVMMAYGKGL